MTHTVDALLGGRLKFRQPRRGFRVTIDAPALVFAALLKNLRPHGNLLDAGCGVGSCGLAYVLHQPGWSLSGLELQDELVQLARESARQSAIAGAEFIAGDLRDPSAAPGPFDLILCNPPYFDPARNSLSPHAGKNLAKFEIALLLAELNALLAPRLAPEGRAFIILPWEKREKVARGPLFVRSLRPVAHAPASPPGKAIVELRATTGPCEELPPLILFRDAAKKIYSPIFGKFLAGGMLPQPVNLSLS